MQWHEEHPKTQPPRDTLYDKVVIPVVIGFAGLCMVVSIVQKVTGYDGAVVPDTEIHTGAIR